MPAPSHRKSGTQVYNIWQIMKRRCQNPEFDAYPFYGGRGITVCERWLKFENFFSDMGEPPERHTLDRIDSNGHYEPGNCRWANKETQANNCRNNHRLTIDGETLTASQWARRSPVGYFTIVRRIKLGWEHKRAVFEPATIGKNQFSKPLEPKS